MKYRFLFFVFCFLQILMLMVSLIPLTIAYEEVQQERIDPQVAYQVLIPSQKGGLSFIPEIDSLCYWQYPFLNDEQYSAYGENNLGDLFQIKHVEGKGFKIICLASPDKCLQACEGIAILEESADIVEQYWDIEVVDTGGYIITSMKEGMGSISPSPHMMPNYTGYHIIISQADEDNVWHLQPRNLSFHNHQVYVHAPIEWKPGLSGNGEENAIWNGTAVMQMKENGWYSFISPGTTEIAITNLTCIPDGGIHLDSRTHFIPVKENCDVWIIIKDNPEVEGDLNYSISYAYPHDESPKTGANFGVVFATGWLLLSLLGEGAIARHIVLLCPKNSKLTPRFYRTRKR